MRHPGTMRLAAGFGLSLAILPLAACDDDPKDGRRTHVVCHSGGIRVLDDFGADARHVEGGISYTSDTIHARTRVTGDCAAFKDVTPDGWKVLLPGRAD